VFLAVLGGVVVLGLQGGPELDAGLEESVPQLVRVDVGQARGGAVRSRLIEEFW
jgi:hypothetical protein